MLWIDNFGADLKIEYFFLKKLNLLLSLLSLNNRVFCKNENSNKISSNAEIDGLGVFFYQIRKIDQIKLEADSLIKFFIAMESFDKTPAALGASLKTLESNLIKIPNQNLLGSQVLKKHSLSIAKLIY